MNTSLNLIITRSILQQCLLASTAKSSSLSRRQSFPLGTLATAAALLSLLLKVVPDSSNGDSTSKGRLGTLPSENKPRSRKNAITFILTIVQKGMVGKKKKERKIWGLRLGILYQQSQLMFAAQTGACYLIQLQLQSTYSV